MILTRGLQRTLIAVSACILLAIYGFEWLTPGIGLFREDAVNLLAAKSVPHSGLVPLFPLLLAVFAAISMNAQWLKLLPVACTLGWLTLTYRLLRRMGASSGAGLLLIGLTAVAPAVVVAGTNLFPEPLFGLLVTAALLALLDDRAILAGVLAGLATITEPAGVALIVACMVTFVARQRLRNAVLFTAAAMILVAPWFGWTLAHMPHSAVSLRANEKLVVIGKNLYWLLAAPFEAMTSIASTYAVVATVALFLWALVRRRQFVPDLFLALYCGVLICWPAPPGRMVMSVLPLLLWLLWRAFGNMRIKEAIAALVLILVALSLWADVARRPAANDWAQMRRMFAYLRENAPPDAVIMANLDPAFELNTGRTAIRGFTPENYRLFYAPPTPAVTPDQLATALRAGNASYVVVTPDRNLPEGDAYRKAVEALERGDLLEPVSVTGLNRDYRVLRTR